MNFLLCLPILWSLFSAQQAPAFTYGYVHKEGTEPIYVALANDNDERQYGLMNRVEWGALQGMWFDFEQERNIRMWMKNTLLPLDMAFLSDSGHVVHVELSAQPMSESIIQPRKHARYVLELPAGQVKALNIAMGDHLRFVGK